MTTFENNENINTSNSIVYNNYSIQNVYISPSNFTSFNKIPMNVEEYVQKKQIVNEGAFAPVPKKINVKIDNYIGIPSNIIFNNHTPMPSKITSNKLIYQKFEKNNLFKTPKDVKIVSFFNSANSFEKHPQDSVKKAIIKKKYIYRNSDFNKNLKSSLSQGSYKKFKKPKSSPKNHLNVRKLKLLGKEAYPRNNLSPEFSLHNSQCNERMSVE